MSLAISLILCPFMKDLKAQYPIRQPINTFKYLNLNSNPEVEAKGALYNKYLLDLKFSTLRGFHASKQLKCLYVVLMVCIGFLNIFNIINLF